MRRQFIPIVILMIILTVTSAVEGECTETLISPKMAVQIYFDAYVAQDWEVVTEYMHPELLQSLKYRIIEMIQKVSPATRRRLMMDYQVRSLGELKLMPSRQLYVLYLQNRWEWLDDQSVEGIGNTEISFIKTTRISNEECLVDFKTSVSRDNQSYDKLQSYHMKKYNGRWKIFNTEGLKKLDKKTVQDRDIL